MVLSFYTLPTLGSAYYYGRRHATLTALGSVLLVILMTWYNPVLVAAVNGASGFASTRWLDITVWGGVLIITGYSMGTLYEHKTSQIDELRETYHGVLMILRHFIAKDTYTENHCIASRSMPRRSRRAEPAARPRRGRACRGAAARHRQARHEPRAALQGRAADQGGIRADAAARPARVSRCSSPSVDRSGVSSPSCSRTTTSSTDPGYHPTRRQDIPIEARILSVADVYDSLTSDRPYRKAMSPFEAKDIIVKGSGTDFDPQVVAAFTDAFRRGGLEVPAVVV